MKPVRPRKHGFTMFAVLALATVLSALAVGWAREAVRGNQASKLLHLRAQAAWLIHAGFSRARSQLQADDRYPGETWRLGADQLGQSIGAEVLIEKVATDAAPTFRCRVRLPPGDDCRLQLTRSFTLTSAASRLKQADQGESE